MAYDTALAERIRAHIAPQTAFTEKHMFGGLAFLVGGNMAIAASGQGGILVRVNPAASNDLVASTQAEPMEMRGRSMTGWLRVDSQYLQNDNELVRWVGIGVDYARSLPLKKK